MFRSTIISILAISAALVGATRVPGACYQDNCQRAVQRLWAGQAVYDQHMVQCASALSCSSTPAATTTTAVETITSGVLTINVAKATVTANPIPSVLSCPTAGLPADQSAGCEGSFVSYSSACSCASVTATTSVAPTPVVTETVTTIIPATIIYV